MARTWNLMLWKSGVNRFVRRVIKLSLRAFLLTVPFCGTTLAQTVEYMHTDALGSIVAISDENGSVVERNEYEPFGYDLSVAEDGPGYAGHVSDRSTGLSYMEQRYYDAQIGRFLSVDPVANGGAGQNFNRYWYANNNPYGFHDPDGRQACGKNTTCRLANGDRGYSTAGRAGRTAEKSYTFASAAQRLAGATRDVEAIKDTMESKTSRTEDGSAARFARLMQPISTKYGVEIGSAITAVSELDPSQGFKLSGTEVSQIFRPDNVGRNMFIGLPNYLNIHTHPVARFPGEWFDPFSPGDVQSNGWVSIPGAQGELPRVFNYTKGKGVREIPLK